MLLADSEVFAICSLGLFLPICLEKFARDNGVLDLDSGRNIPCPSASEADLGIRADGSPVRCVVNIAGLWIDTASFRYAQSIDSIMDDTDTRRKLVCILNICRNSSNNSHLNGRRGGLP